MSTTITAATTARLSVAIITHNEEANIERTLRSVAFAGEVIVVDSGSTDRTAELARALGAKVIEHPWHGFAQQKNFAMELCTGEWILSLDADEELTPELQQEIQTLVGHPAQSDSAGKEASFSSPRHDREKTGLGPDAFFIKRRNLFLGRWIRHAGFYPDAKLRLFRRGLKLTFGERAVHETITASGATSTLTHDLIHHAYPTLAGYLDHMNRYSSLGAEVLVQRGRISRSWLAFLWNVWIVPVITFKWNLIVRGGILDGREGILLNLYQAAYTSWKYAKAWETTKGVPRS